MHTHTHTHTHHIHQKAWQVLWGGGKHLRQFIQDSSNCGPNTHAYTCTHAHAHAPNSMAIVAWFVFLGVLSTPGSTNTCSRSSSPRRLIPATGPQVHAGSFLQLAHPWESRVWTIIHPSSKGGPPSPLLGPTTSRTGPPLAHIALSPLRLTRLAAGLLFSAGLLCW